MISVDSWWSNAGSLLVSADASLMPCLKKLPWCFSLCCLKTQRRKERVLNMNMKMSSQWKWSGLHLCRLLLCRVSLDFTNTTASPPWTSEASSPSLGRNISLQNQRKSVFDINHCAVICTTYVVQVSSAHPLFDKTYSNIVKYKHLFINGGNNEIDILI